MNSSHRSIYALRGAFVDFAVHYHKHFADLNALCVSNTADALIKTIPYKHALNKLGQEVDVVVFDASQTLEVNAFGAICGCIRGGGALILLLPTCDTHYKSSLFYQRLLRLLSEHQIRIDSLHECPQILTGTHLKPLTSHSQHNSVKGMPTGVADQQLAIQGVRKVVTGHRNRPLVITADRGRGKSSAIGMAINALLSERTLTVLVCAPAKAMIAPLINFAGQPENLHYIAPDALVRELPEAGLVIIDEAGAIPVPLLSTVLQHYSRLVFSTTLHGYEGNGNGFAIRFHALLNRFTPNWQSITLNQPIRWGIDDPLEKLINHLLLLAPEPITEKPLNLTQRTSDTLVYKKINRSCLLKNEQQLKQLFGLLVIAHYQTRPSDLLHILDAQALSIHTVFRGDQIIAAAIVSHEGGFDPALAMAVYRGERRPKGHLVPQILLSQVGLLEAASLTTDRIMRIATHPSYRRQQVASYLLQAIAAQSASDYLSTSFGLSGTLFSFWQQAMFAPVYLGMKREASSGYHSAVFLHALTQSGEALLHASSQSFARNLVAQLADSLKDYDAEITSNLLAVVAQPPTTLCPQEIRDIQRFSQAQCGLDSAAAALQRWLPKALAENKQKLQNKEAKLLIMRILQHHNWSHCCKMLGLPSKQIAQHTLQAATATLAEGLAVGTDASMEGLTSIKD